MILLQEQEFGKDTSVTKVNLGILKIEPNGTTLGTSNGKDFSECGTCTGTLKCPRCGRTKEVVFHIHSKEDKENISKNILKHLWSMMSTNNILPLKKGKEDPCPVCSTVFTKI